MLTREQAFPRRVAGVIRSQDPEAAFRACVAAMEGGIGTVEVAMTVPSCLDVVGRLAAVGGGSFPVGVGAVVEPATVAQARAAGAAFVATPAVIPAVAEACAREEVLCVLGALTPTEVHQARAAGAHLVRVFPVQAVGGPDYVRWLRGPMPDVPLWVSGGVAIEQVELYLSLGAAVVGLATALFPPDAVDRGDTARITNLARRAAAATGAVWA